MWWWLPLACGWHLGSPALPALSAGPVQYTGPEPAVRGAVESAVATRLAELGARGDQPLSLVLTATDAPEAADADARGTVAWTWTWRAEWTAGGDCAGDVSARRTYVADGANVASPRAASARALADDVADRVIAAVLATPGCAGLRRLPSEAP